MHTHICCNHTLGEWTGPEGHHVKQICCLCGIDETISRSREEPRVHGPFKPKGPVRLVPPATL